MRDTVKGSQGAGNEEGKRKRKRSPSLYKSTEKREE